MSHVSADAGRPEALDPPRAGVTNVVNDMSSELSSSLQGNFLKGLCDIIISEQTNRNTSSSPARICEEQALVAQVALT